MSSIKEFEVVAENQIATLGLQSLDVVFAQFIYQQSSPKCLSVALFAGILSQRLRQQDSCLELADMSSATLRALGVPSLSVLMEKLSQSNCVTNQPEEIAGKPIVIEHQLGYLRRYYDYEVSLAKVIQQRLKRKLSVDTEKLRELIKELFPVSTSADIDWQKVAVCVAASQSFCVITGGPGTGKTTTVAKLLAVLQGLEPNRPRPLAIKLVAPTGKAAARLSDSLARAKQALPEKYQPILDAQSSTIHRLLGVKHRSVDFKHDGQNPMHLDVLIVDEASMVDLPLMCKLLSALPIHARVILLGDHNQLSSVETGSVLFDICQSAQGSEFSPEMNAWLSSVYESYVSQNNTAQNSPFCRETNIQDALVRLQKSHRFSDSSEIGKLSKAVISGEIDSVMMQLSAGHLTKWNQQATINDLVQYYVSSLGAYFTAIKNGDIQQAFLQLEEQQILCAFKSGEWGVDNINRKIEQELTKQDLIDGTERYYAGHPIMLSSNDHNLGLFNGDIAIVMADPDNPQLNKAWFKLGPDEMRGVLLSRLPPHSTVYAMTIHKSQGSEFQSIHLCLPDFVSTQHGTSLSRELFYTGLTRARESFSLYSKKDVLLKCLSSHCRRSSGLSQRLNPGK